MNETSGAATLPEARSIPAVPAASRVREGARPVPGGNLVPVLLQVTREDIQRMDYHFNESPMGNIATHNGVAFALRRVVDPALGVSASLCGAVAFARIGAARIRLASEVALWIESASTGRPVEPAVWLVWLPREFVVFS